MYVYMYCALCTAGWGMYGSGQTDCFARASTQRRYIEDSSHLVQSLLRTIDDGGSYLILFLLEVCGTVGPSIPLTVKVSRWVVCWKYEIVGGSYWSLSSIGRKFLSAKEFKSVFFFFFFLIAEMVMSRSDSLQYSVEFYVGILSFGFDPRTLKFALIALVIW